MSLKEGVIMITEKGVIQKILHQKALVRIQKNSACTSCESRGACRALSDKEMLIEVPNDLQAQVGDHVEIYVHEGSLLKLSLLVYLLPVGALILGASIGGIWAQSFRAGATLAPMLCGFFAMGATFYALKRLDRAAQAKGKYQPRMKKILQYRADE
jgi:sigma-E factor negative regulatory protein RseC